MTYLFIVCVFVCWTGKRQRVSVTLSLRGEGIFKRMVSQAHMYKSQTLTEGWLCLLHYTWHQLILCSCSVHKHLLTCGLHTRAVIWVELYLNICTHTDRYCVYMCIWIYICIWLILGSQRASLSICCMDIINVLWHLYWYLTIYLPSDFMSPDVCKYSLFFSEESSLSLLSEIKCKGKKSETTRSWWCRCVRLGWMYLAQLA